MKFLIRDRVFGIGEDFWVEDENGRKVFLVDGKALRIRQTFELKTREGEVVAVIRKKLMSVHDAMVIERGGDKIATVHKKHFTLLRDHLKVDHEGGGEWTVRGDLLDKEYGIEGDEGQGPVALISRKWFRVRDTYAVDIVDGYDVPLVLAVAVCVDALTEDKHDD
ncbi:LURP-one-related/scramblase family protein [Actinomadura gamaensis]|uniref:LURP-one-related/scramblase family protein n=1 Tax=Actinomadura gamaensis TaxID=1763541 RepID=A0ABV9U276_9ACTN